MMHDPVDRFIFTLINAAVSFVVGYLLGRFGPTLDRLIDWLIFRQK